MRDRIVVPGWGMPDDLPPAPAGDEPPNVCFWVFDVAARAAACQLCGEVVPGAIVQRSTGGPRDFTYETNRLLVHQLGCRGVPRDVAMEISERT